MTKHHVIDPAKFGLSPHDPNIISNRIAVFQDTETMSKRYPLPPPSTKYHVRFPFTPMSVRYSHTVLEVVGQDTIDAALHGLKNPCALNLSDDCYAGGNVCGGSGAQEESLWRRTNYCATLLRDFYPLTPEEAVYSPNVSVFKESEQAGWQLLQEPFPELAFIACPGLRKPQCINNRISPECEEVLRHKIRLIFKIAFHHGHDSLVLGALGAGVFGSPPQHAMAQS